MQPIMSKKELVEPGKPRIYKWDTILYCRTKKEYRSSLKCSQKKMTTTLCLYLLLLTSVVLFYVKENQIKLHVIPKHDDHSTRLRIIMDEEPPCFGFMFHNGILLGLFAMDSFLTIKWSPSLFMVASFLFPMFISSLFMLIPRLFTQLTMFTIS
eukprot:UN29393